MSAETDNYSEWDAAYVLGALTPEERRDYERHLGTCAACSRAVAELAGMPGLLAAVPIDQALLLEHPDPVTGDLSRIPDAALPRLLAAVRKQRRRARALIAGALVLAAAAAATVALVLPGWFWSTDREPVTTSMTMHQVVRSPLSADVQLAGQSWGTRIESRCSYAESKYDAGEQAYAMYVTDRKGTSSLVATWLAEPGTTVSPVGTTSLATKDIATVDIRSVKTGQVLLESTLAP